MQIKKILVKKQAASLPDISDCYPLLGAEIKYPIGRMRYQRQISVEEGAWKREKTYPTRRFFPYVKKKM